MIEINQSSEQIFKSHSNKTIPQSKQHKTKWATVSIGKLANYVNGRAFKPSEWESSGLPIVRIQNLNDKTASYNYSSKKFESKYLIKHGDLLFAWSASLGAYIWQGTNAWLNQHIFKVEPYEIVNKKFLFYLLKNIIAELNLKAHGSGMVHITKKKFEQTQVSIPPLAEQNRIVEKIETLFFELDKGINILETTLKESRILRQSILAKALSEPLMK